MKMKLADLKIDDDFKGLLPGLDPEIYTDLEKDIVANGMFDPIVIWNGYIADGHNRYSICKAHRIAEVEVKELRKDSKAKVMEWIVDHQFSKRNLLLSQKYTLLSKVKEQVEKEKAEKSLSNLKQNKSTERPNLDSRNGIQAGRTDEIMASKLGVSRNTFRDIDTVMKEGTDEQKARMDKGGKGNGVSAIAKEIKDKKNGIPEGHRKCRKCGKILEAYMFSSKNPICKPCDAAEKRKQYDQKRGVSEYSKIVDFLKDEERDTSGSEENTYAEVNALNVNWISSFKRIMSTGVYNKDGIISLLSSFVDQIKKEYETL